jgi:hypothetical protein
MAVTASGRPPPTGEGLTYEKVWAMFQETERQFKEIAELRREEHERLKKEHEQWYKETERQFKESAEQRQKEAEQRQKEHEQSFREIERQFKEIADLRREEHERFKKEHEQWYKETSRIVKRNSKQLGDLHRRFGQLAEHLVAPGIVKRFNERGYHFSEVAPRGHRIVDEQGKIKAEVDILLQNGDCIVGVEVKSTPAVKDVEHHVRRLEILRENRNKINDKRKIHGAIAGAIYDNYVKKAVRDAGMYVIEQSGDTMKIDMPDDFVPQEW